MECRFWYITNLHFLFLTMNRYLILLLTLLIFTPSKATERTDSLSKKLDEIVIDGNIRRSVESTDIGRIKLSQEQFSKMPSLLSESDVIKVLQMQPGVSQGMEGFAGLYVHGGEDDQNLFLFDGLPLYQVSHLGGIFSSFNVAAISGADFFKTSFPSQYGGRISSITEILMRDSNKNKYTGELSLGLICGNAFVSGPLVKDKTGFSLGVRRTWLDAISAPTLAIMNAIDKSKGKKTMAGYAFTDLNVKIDHSFSPSLNASVMAYYSNDRLKFGERLFNEKKSDEDVEGFEENSNKFGWGNSGVCATLNYKTQKTSLEGVAYWSKYNSQYEQLHEYHSDVTDELSYGKLFETTQNEISDFGARINFNHRFDERYKFSSGAEWINHNYLPEGLESLRIVKGKESKTNNISERVRANEMSLWVEGSFTPVKMLSASIGLRQVNYWSGFKSYHMFEPRASLRLSITDDVSVKLGYSKMSQFAQQVSNNHISFPTDLWQPIVGEFKPLTSNQFSLGCYGSLGNSYLLVGELWYKRFDNLLEYREGITMLNPNLKWNEKLTSGEGWAYGLDLSLTKTIGRINGSVSYGLMWNWRKFEELNQGIKFPAKFDNRHKINIALNYEITDRLSASASWTYTTGNRITLSLYNYDTSLVLFPDAPKHEYGSVSGSIFTGVGYVSGRNNARLPAYHRMDLGLSYTNYMKNGRKGVWNVSLYNAYCHMNAITIQKDNFNNRWGQSLDKWHRAFKTFSLIPIIPSVSYTYHF